MPKNLLDDGSIKLSANLNWNGYSIINLKELLPQATGTGNIGRWNFRWNSFNNVINLQNFNIRTTDISSTGSTSTSNGVSLEFGVSIPPNDINIATMDHQSGIFFDDNGQILFKFSQTPTGDTITTWTPSVIIDKDGITIDTLTLTSLYVDYIHAASTSSTITIEDDVVINGSLTVNNGYLTNLYVDYIYANTTGGTITIGNDVNINSDLSVTGSITTTTGIFINGYLRCNVVSTDDDYAVEDDDCIIFVDTEGKTITLPAVTISNIGRIIIIRNTFATGGNTTISCTSNINGSSAEFTLGSDSSIIFAAKGQDDGWWSISCCEAAITPS